MKKNLTLICAVITATLLCSLQKTTAQSWVIGGNTVTKDTSFGTKNAYAVKFITNNAQRMIINNAGDIGVGTSSLYRSKFNVNGGVGHTTAIFGNAAHGLSLVYDNPTLGFNTYNNSDVWKILTDGYGGYIQVNSSSGQMQFATLPTAAKDVTVTPAIRMTILQNGYVGIGTVVPASKLQVNGDETLIGNLNMTSDQKSIQFALPGSTPASMMYMFPSGTSNTNRMVIAHSPAFSNWGLQYSDATDQFNFLGGGANIMSIGLGSGYVGIGTATPGYTLDVESAGTAVYGNTTSNSGYGIYGNSPYLGIYGVGGAYGVYGYSSSNSGVYGSSGYIGVNGSATSYGLNGVGTSDGSYGVAGTGGYIGVFGASEGTSVVGNSTNGEGANFYSTNYNALVAGTGRTDKNYAAVFNGNTYAYGSYVTSDRNLKKKITEFGDAMSIINKLKPKTYEFIQEGKYAAMHLPSGQQYGLIAQDLETVLPGLVKDVDYTGPVAAKMADTSASTHKTASSEKPAAASEKITTKAVNYVELIPIMIKAMQEQQVTIDAQNDKIETLTELVNQLLKTNGNANALSATSAFLGDASPNPANNTTRIAYGIPSGTTKAELVIHSISGVKLRQVTLNNSGLININTSGLSAGTYTYTLIANGTVVDTKKMVIAK